MEKSFIIPSVFEENSMLFSKVADNFIDGIRIVHFKEKDYIIGNLALKEGVVKFGSKRKTSFNGKTAVKKTVNVILK